MAARAGEPGDERAAVANQSRPSAVTTSQLRPGRAHDFTQRCAAYRSDRAAANATGDDDVQANLRALVDIAVPSFADWCFVDLVDDRGELRRVATSPHQSSEPDGAGRPLAFGDDPAPPRGPDLDRMSQRVLDGARSVAWPATRGALARCVVAGLRVNDRNFATVTFRVDEASRGFGPEEISAIEEVAQSTASAIERVILQRGAREAARRTQRIASQLHQLIATSITMTGQRDEHDILLSLVGRTRSVFDADTALVSLETGPAAPLRVVAERGGSVQSLGPDDVTRLGDLPRSRSTNAAPWRENNWLVASMVEKRNQARGVVAIRRTSGTAFDAEDQEVLTLLAQMASNALGAVELSRSIQNSEARWRILVQTAPVGIVEIDVDGAVRWWNRTAGKIFGWSEYHESLDVATSTFPETFAPQFTQLWSEVLNGESVRSRDFIDVDINARLRDLTISATILPSADAVARSILMLVDDVTDHRQLKAELRHAHGMEIRGQVASSVAHDFNNLLTLISGYAEILSQDLGTDQRASQMVKEIQSTAARASTLTGQLQTIGRTKAPEPVVLSPVAVIESNAEVLERIVGVDVELRWSLDDDSPNIRVDADQFEQMILNLALNARDAMPTGGQLSISVTTWTIDADHSLHTHVGPGDYVHIRFSDTGVGMDEVTRQHCFEPLFTTKDPLKGTGLGLAAAWRLVQESEGSIECLSELGRGTTFEILLPAIDEPVAATPSVTRTRPRPTATVLVAEDDDGLRRLMGQVLRRNGYVVLEAESGERALEVAQEFDGPIDLLVSDVVMASISGDVLAKTLQAANSDLLVLLTSGSADASVLADLIAGSSGFLAKPFKPSELVHEIQQLLSS